jgi:site-specific recombinase
LTDALRPDWAVALDDLLRLADPDAGVAASNLWLARLNAWLAGLGPSAALPCDERLARLADALDRDADALRRLRGVVQGFAARTEFTSLLADFGFAARPAFFGELVGRALRKLLPVTPDSTELAQLYPLLLPGERHAQWLREAGEPALERLAALLLQRPPAEIGHAALRLAITFCISQVRATGFLPDIRSRMSAASLATQPFLVLARAWDDVQAALDPCDAQSAAQLPQRLNWLRAALAACDHAAASVYEHLDDHGVSVGIVFTVEQLRARVQRIELLLDALLSPAPLAARARLLAELARLQQQRNSVRALVRDHTGLLARKVTERSAETGEHYITRDAAQYRAMLRAAAGGGALMSITTMLKFAIVALGLGAFWGGFWAGVNYALSFAVIQLLHFTVATKQPAMTAPAMVQRLDDVASDDAVERFVDEVAHLARSQAAGIFGNLALCFPLVLLLQALAWWWRGAPLVGAKEAEYVLHSLSLLGPTPLYAAFTGVLLFASSLVAGWAENWFVFHRIDSAIRWHPRLVALAGAERAARWARFWREHISGLAGNVSLGLMLGIVPAVAAFFGIGLEVRHVTLSTGQLAAALGALGAELLREPSFWWCVAGIALTGLLNVGVSFFLAFRLALRARGLKLHDRSRLQRAVMRRLVRKPISFLFPPRDSAPVAA